MSIQCAQVFLIVKRGTLGKPEAEINPSILAATSDLTRYVAHINCRHLASSKRAVSSHRVVEDIHDAARQCLARKRSSRLLYAKTDQDRVAGWKEDLANIMRIFNVRRSIAYWCCMS